MRAITQFIAFWILIISCDKPKTVVENPPAPIAQPSSFAISGIKRLPNGSSDGEYFLKGLKISSSPQYGYSQLSPIKVGQKGELGIGYSIPYLNSLRGPMGQIIQYERQGSCCAFSTPNGIDGEGLLDVYSITYIGCKEPITLYLNIYDYGPMENSS